MSAFVGLYRLDGQPVTAHDLQPLMDACAFYGGDGQGVWTEGPVGLGFHLRHLTWESLNDHQPYVSGPLAIVADARIDNRDDLFAALSTPHDERTGMPDSVLILRAYEKWGRDTAIHLIGDFAFAIWDARTRELYCARDHIGVHPFYYYCDSDKLIFSSDMRALSAFPNVKIEPNEEVIIDILHHKLVLNYDAHRTLYCGFMRLPFAHQMVVSASGLRLEEYWHPVTEPILELGSHEAYFESVRELADRAVKDRLRTDLRVAAHVSGGVDSSSVAIMAARHLRERGRDLIGYSWAPPGPDNPTKRSEHYRINAVARQEGIEMHYAPPIPFSPFQPVTLQHHLLQLEHEVLTEAAKMDIRLILSGWVGDEFASFNGRGYRAALFRQLRWYELFQTFNWSKFPRGLRTNVAYFWRDVVNTLAPDWYYVKFTKMGRFYSLKPNTDFVLPEFAERVRAASMRAQVVRYQDIGVKATQVRLYRQGHVPERMERWHLGAALEGTSYTYPLADRRLMEFVLRVPDDLFMGNHIRRYLYRKAMAPLFPPDIFDVPDIYPKNDPSMLAHQRMVAMRLREQDSRNVHVRMLRQTDNPWVDVERVKAFAIKHNYQTSGINTVECHAYQIAIALLYLWEDIRRMRAQQRCLSQPVAAEESG
jgi:asparagine synthase (glutamine-hydrolysing)